MSDYPLLTIAMPIWNRKYSIDKVLDSILSQTYPKERIKIVFVDNYSMDGTTEIIKKFSAKEKDNYIDIAVIVEKSNIPEARNICIKNAVGEFILFWDSDVLMPDAEAIEKCINFLIYNNAASNLAIPCYEGGKSDYWYVRVVNLKIKEGINECYELAFSFNLFRKSVFDKIGVFNTLASFSEDKELMLRMKKHGLKSYVNSSITAIHLKENRIKHSYLAYVKRCFLEAGSQQYQQVLNHAWKGYLPIIIYGLFPIALILALFISPIFAFYFLPLLLYQIFKAKRNRPYGIILFFYYILPGMATAYGYLNYKIIGWLRRLNKLGKTR